MKRVRLTINGIEREFSVNSSKVLIDLLREDLRLTGTKQSCDRKGQCGACTVIVDGKAVRSCLKKVFQMDGANIITIEGLGTPENPHLIQEAFVLSGAIQCGFCTPGMIISTKVLLDKNPDPSIQEIKNALSHNLCRCTGYKKIIDAVRLSSQFIRGETTPQAVRIKIGRGMLGVSHPRPTAILKACGVAKFNADVDLPPDTLQLALVHSTEFHAKIKSIDPSAALKMPGVIGIMTAEDIKGTNRIRVVVPDQPVLCEDRVRTLGDPIVAVAARTREQARAAASTVEVEYERLPVIRSCAEAIAPGAYQIHPNAENNIYAARPLIKGDAEKAMKEAVTTVEAEFSTQTTHMAPLEPEIASAYFDGTGDNPQLVVVGRSINIHAHLAQIKEAVGYENMRYREALSGGQFGIKAMVSTEVVTAAAALHFKRAVQYIPSLTESMLLSSKRHAYPSQKLKLGADADGHITSLYFDFIADKGAYTLQGIVDFIRTMYMMSGSFYIPNIKASGLLVYTNNPGSAAARGAGPPQSNFPLESIIDMLAEKRGIDPLDFRRMNSLKVGQSKATGMIVNQWSYVEVCDAMKPYYQRAKKACEAFNSKNAKLKHGVGIAGHSFGIGNPGDSATLVVEVDRNDNIIIFAAVADPGEGNDSMLTQIAAHQLNMPFEKILLRTRDTSETIAMGPAAGSRMTFMAGNALIDAVSKLKKVINETGTGSYAGLKKAGQPTRYEGFFKNDISTAIDKETGKCNSQVSEVHNLQLAEVEVNTETGEVRVLKITSVVDAGTIINPQNFEGQIEGGVDQGVGFALREEYIPGKTTDWVSFKFPTINDSFNTEIVCVQTPRVNGPLGATGIGEMTMISTAPAVINAIKNACGVRIYNLPATPEKVKAALLAQK